MPTLTPILALNAQGDQVKAVHANLAKVGLPVPTTETSAGTFGAGSVAAVKQFQAQAKLPVTGTVDIVTQAMLINAAAIAGTNRSSVSGRLFMDYGLAANGVTVRLYSIGYGGAATKLAEGKTDTNGVYSLAYVPAATGTNIEIRAVDPQGREIVLSIIIYNAPRIQVLNLVAPASIQPPPAEYQRLSTDMEKTIGGIQNLSKAQETDSQRDLTLLNQASGWDARLVALAATAAQQATVTGMGQDVLYALYRVGLPSDPQHLALVPTATVQAALKKANNAGIVNLNDQQIAAAATSFQTFSGKTRMTMTTPGATSSFSQILSSAILNPDQQATFAKLYFSNPSAGADLWKEAARLKLPAQTLDALKLQGKFLYLSFNNAALAHKLQQDIGSLENISRLADKDYHDGATWKAALTELAGTGGDKALQELIPAIYGGKTTADRLEAYAADLARKVRFSFPTQVAARQIENKQLPMDQATGPKLTAFLRSAAPLGYELGRTPLNAFLRNSAKKLPDMDAASKESLMTLHRLYQVTPSTESLQAAMKLGFTSAYDITSYTQDEFIAKYSGYFPSPWEASLVYAKSQQVSSVTFNFFVAASHLDNAPPVYALSASNDDRQNAKNAIVQQFPTMEGLFGSMDYCDCKDCRSVLSPAAYFVDLLEFLRKSGANQAGYTPLDVLVGKDKTVPGRRPDLAALPLTCENTNTAMPYIDLVNEILEYYIANKSLDAGAAYDTGSATTADLTAEPQHILPAVYNDNLKTAVYPLNLPFDLWIETVRGFFNYFKNPLGQVLEVLRPADNLELFTDGNSYNYYRAQICAESLGLSPAEYGVLTVIDPSTHKPSVANWFQLYGYAGEATALSELKSAKTLAQRLGLTYQEVTDLVTTGFLNPGLYALIFQFERFGISMDDAFSYTHQPGHPALGAQANADFESMLAAITARYKKQNPASTFDAKVWLTNLLPANYSQEVLVLDNPDSGCNFSNTTLQYSDGSAAKPLDYLKFNLFARLWKKLGWTVDETDRAMQLFFLSNLPAWTDPNFANAFNAAWKTALVYLAHLDDLNSRLNPALGRVALLPLWANLSVQGANPLYAQLFLTPSVLNNDWAFDDPAGQFPTSATDLPAALRLFPAHQAAVQGALGLTSDEVGAILTDAGVDLTTAGFTLANLSTCYRYSMLAKCLQLSASDMIALKAMSGLNPFQALGTNPLAVLPDDVIFNQTLRFVQEVAAVQNSGFSVEDLKYLLRHQFDPVGKYQSDPNTLMSLVQLVANGLLQIQTRNTVPPDLLGMPENQIEQQLSRLFPAKILKSLFTLLTNSQTFSASQDGIATGIDPTPFVQETELAFSYDPVTKTQTVSFTGLLLDWKKAQLEQLDASPLFSGLLDVIQQNAQPALTRSVDDILGVWASLTEYESVRTGVSTGLPAATLMLADPALSLSYDQTDKLQWMAYRGVLTDARKSVLMGVNIPPALSPLLSALMSDIQQQAMPGYSQLIGALLAMWVNVQSFTASQTGVASANQVDAAAFFAALSAARQGGAITDPVPSIQFYYDSAAQVQKVTILGVLTDKMRGELTGLIPASATLASVLQTARNQAVQLFQTLAANHLTVVAADLDNYSQRFIDVDISRQQKQVKAELVSVFLPLMVQKLSRQLVLQTLEANPGSDPSLTEALVTDAALLTDPGNPGKSLLGTFLAVGQQGVTASYFASTDGSGAPLATATAAGTDLADPTNPNAGKAGTGSVHFEGYLQVPTDGPYRFFAELGNTNAAALFHLESPDPLALLNNPIIPSTSKAAKDHDEVSQFVQLKGGTPYHFTLDFINLGANGASLLVQGETLPKGPLSQVVLYPQAAVAGFNRGRVLLAKVLQILQGTGLDLRELSNLTANSAQFNNLRLSALPTQPSDDTLANASALFSQFLTLADYADLRKGPAGGSDGLVDVFENVGQTFTEAATSQDSNKDPGAPWTRFANLTRRDPQVVRDVAKYFGLIQEQVVGPNRQVKAVGDFGNNKGIRRIWQGIQLAQIMGIPVASLTASTLISSLSPPVGSPNPDVTAANLKNAVKARFTADAWRPIAKSIFDPLRQKKRDALVSYLINVLALEDADQLFEYFLVDPGMEPVVQTSRLRLALSSVQTFVQRCLLNLENGNSGKPALNISPNAIDADWWEWMKRYRVWQANREIFLFPENWMIPEFRMDKTDLFQTMESALLQGDVTRDLVEDAFLTYLKGLEERARLDMAAMYLDQDPNHLDVSTLYVLARTYGIPHKYFYRTYSSGSWSGWEAVTPNIEGNHIVLAIWRGRLNIFWLTFVQKPQLNSNASSDSDTTTVANLSFGDLSSKLSSSAPQTQLQVQLNWCEYFQGKWSNPISTDIDRYPPITGLEDSFDVNQDVYVHVSKEVDSDGNEGAVKIHLDLNGYDTFLAFRLTSKNCAPDFSENYWETGQAPPYNTTGIDATLLTGTATLQASFESNIVNNDISSTIEQENILDSANNYALLICGNRIAPPFLNEQTEPLYWDAGNLVSPFFFKDTTNPNAASQPARFFDELTFFVQPSLTEKTIVEWEGWAIAPYTPAQNWADPNVLNHFNVIAQVPLTGPKPVDPGYSVNPMQPEVDWVTNPATAISYGEAWIGKGGGVNVKGFSTVSAGASVSQTGAGGLTGPALAGRFTVSGGLVLVGGQGMRAGQMQAINALTSPAARQTNLAE